MTISIFEVKQILKLSKLSINLKELAIFSTDLDKVITFFSSIHNFDTENIEPMVSPLKEGVRLRADIPEHEDLGSQFSDFCPYYEQKHCIVPVVIN